MLLNFVFKSVATQIPNLTRLVDPRWSPFTPTFSIIISLDPIGGSKTEPGLLRRFQLSSQNILFGLFHYRLFNYAETLHLGQTHKQLQLTKCIYQIMPLYTHILLLFIFACFHSTNHLSYHNIHFQCNNSIHN